MHNHNLRFCTASMHNCIAHAICAEWYRLFAQSCKGYLQRVVQYISSELYWIIAQSYTVYLHSCTGYLHIIVQVICTDFYRILHKVVQDIYTELYSIFALYNMYHNCIYQYNYTLMTEIQLSFNEYLHRLLIMITHSV